MADQDHLASGATTKIGEAVFDIAMSALDEGEARRLAVENDQWYIWGVADEREIEVGGTGS